MKLVFRAARLAAGEAFIALTPSRDLPVETGAETEIPVIATRAAALRKAARGLEAHLLFQEPEPLSRLARMVLLSGGKEAGAEVDVLQPDMVAFLLALGRGDQLVWLDVSGGQPQARPVHSPTAALAGRAGIAWLIGLIQAVVDGRVSANEGLLVAHGQDPRQRLGAVLGEFAVQQPEGILAEGSIFLRRPHRRERQGLVAHALDGGPEDAPSPSGAPLLDVLARVNWALAVGPALAQLQQRANDA
jgi:hypothetical protein